MKVPFLLLIIFFQVVDSKIHSIQSLDSETLTSYSFKCFKFFFFSGLQLIIVLVCFREFKWLFVEPTVLSQKVNFSLQCGRDNLSMFGDFAWIFFFQTLNSYNWLIIWSSDCFLWNAFFQGEEIVSKVIDKMSTDCTPPSNIYFFKNSSPTPTESN